MLHRENILLGLFNILAFGALMTFDAWLLSGECGRVYFYLNEHKRLLKWSVSSNKAAVSLPRYFHSCRGWITSPFYPERETEGGKGGAHLYFAFQAVSRFTSPAPVPSQAPPSLALNYELPDNTAGLLLGTYWPKIISNTHLSLNLSGFILMIFYSTLATFT